MHQASDRGQPPNKTMRCLYSVSRATNTRKALNNNNTLLYDYYYYAKAGCFFYCRKKSVRKKRVTFRDLLCLSSRPLPLNHYQHILIHKQYVLLRLLLLYRTHPQMSGRSLHIRTDFALWPISMRKKSGKFSYLDMSTRNMMSFMHSHSAHLFFLTLPRK